jgi:Arc/MetJ family transcription regulator
MRTNIVLDDELIAEAMRVTGLRTKKKVVERALRELVARHRQRALRDLIGRDLIDPDYDVCAVRAGMTRDLG